MMYDQYQEDWKFFPFLFLSALKWLQYASQSKQGLIYTNNHMDALEYPYESIYSPNLYKFIYVVFCMSKTLMLHHVTCLSSFPNFFYLFSQSWAIEVKFSGVKLICSHGRQIRCEWLYTHTHTMSANLKLICTCVNYIVSLIKAMLLFHVWDSWTSSHYDIRKR